MKNLSKSDLYYIFGYAYHDIVNRDGVSRISKLKNAAQRGLLGGICYDLNGHCLEYHQDRMECPLPPEMEEFLQTQSVPPEEYEWEFLAGYFDAYGEISFGKDNPCITLQAAVVLGDLVTRKWGGSTVTGYKALDLCGFMYEKPKFHHPLKWSTYLELLNFSPDKASVASHSTFDYAKLSPLAMDPFKKRVTDSGADIYVVELQKLYTSPWGAEVYQGKTHLAVKPVFGYAFDINGRSGLPKSGWQFLQGTGICDKSYIGGIEGTFMRLNDEPLPKLPWRALQLVPRDAPLHARYRQVDDLGESDRGAKGFGSSGVH